jgi:hypothetical protein
MYFSIGTILQGLLRAHDTTGIDKNHQEAQGRHKAQKGYTPTADFLNAVNGFLWASDRYFMLISWNLANLAQFSRLGGPARLC